MVDWFEWFEEEFEKPPSLWVFKDKAFEGEA
jgi:hypothetical protein